MARKNPDEIVGASGIRHRAPSNVRRRPARRPSSRWFVGAFDSRAGPERASASAIAGPRTAVVFLSDGSITAAARRRPRDVVVVMVDVWLPFERARVRLAPLLGYARRCSAAGQTARCAARGNRSSRECSTGGRGREVGDSLLASPWASTVRRLHHGFSPCGRRDRMELRRMRR